MPNLVQLLDGLGSDLQFGCKEQILNFINLARYVLKLWCAQTLALTGTYTTYSIHFAQKVYIHTQISCVFWLPNWQYEKVWVEFHQNRLNIFLEMMPTVLSNSSFKVLIIETMILTFFLIISDSCIGSLALDVSYNGNWKCINGSSDRTEKTSNFIPQILKYSGV